MFHGRFSLPANTAKLATHPLRAVHPLAEVDLQTALAKLTDAEILYIRGIAPDAIYQFKHALIMDAAYEAVLKSRRKELHLTIARTIDEKFPTINQAHPEVLARHWAEAGESESAIAAWTRSGEAAESRNAFQEALMSYQQSLAIINTLPASSHRDARELSLLQSALRMLWIIRGPSAKETRDAIERAAALAEKSGNFAQCASWVISRCAAAVDLGDLVAASFLLDHGVELAHREGNPTLVGFIHELQMQARYHCGDFEGVEEHFRAGRKFFDDPGFRQPPGGLVTAFGSASLNAWMLGCVDLARERMAQLVAMIDANNPYRLSLFGIFEGHFRLCTKEYDVAEIVAKRALGLAEQHRFSSVAADARCLLGEARAQLGNPSEGIRLIRRGIADLLEMGGRFGHGRSDGDTSLSAGPRRCR